MPDLRAGSLNLLLPHGFERNYVVGFARGLVAQGVPVLVVSDDESAPALEAAGIPQLNLRGSGEPGRSIRGKLTNLVRYYLSLLWIVSRSAGGTTHFCGVLNSRLILVDGILLPVWLRLWAGRFIYTAHNALPHGRGNSLLFRKVYRWVYRFPHVIIAHTRRVAEELTSEFGVEPSRIRVMSIGLNEEVPQTDLSVQEARASLHIPADRPVALFFGKVEPYKGADVLVEAWGRLRTQGAHLIMVGEAMDIGNARALRAAIAASPAAGSIEWREGFIPNEAVARWMRACDVVVMPYRKIYQSGVVFLCLRFGVPIVATDVGSLREFIDESSGIITLSNDAAGIAGAVDGFFASPGRFQRKEIARRAEKYRWDRQCALIKDLYE